MEVAILLLLTVTLTTASPLRPTHRSDADPRFPPADSVRAPGAMRSKVAQEERAHAPRVIAFHSGDKHVDMDALKLSEGLSWRPRPRRTLTSGCQLGTCQVHNLANTLFNFSKTHGKEESKKASHPDGYGR